MLILHDKPDAAMRRIVVELERIKREGYTSDYWKEVAKLCTTDPWFLIRVVLDWGFPCEDLHAKRIIPFVAKHYDQDVGIFIPRGHIKTLTFSALTIFEILRNPNCAVLIASATEKLTQDTAKLISNTLLKNPLLQGAFPELLPSSKTESQLWGKDGYALPNRKDRIDPTLFMASLGANVTGRHPDLIWPDDLLIPANNTPAGYVKIENFFNECKALLPPHGRLWVTGTRYNDADPYGKILEGKLLGNKGPFNTLVLSCYENDDEKQAPIYVPKVRWNMQIESGYSHKLLEQKRKELGVFFNAQYRNNPLPDSDQIIRLSDINVYDPKDLPRYGRCMGLGIEITGGGRLIYTNLEEECEKLKISLPLRELTTPRKAGLKKSDRILSTLEPVVRQGKLYLKAWMKGDGADSDSLGYELVRLGVAKHDDIADALHNVISQMACGLYPTHRELPHLYIAVDPAFSEKERSDWSVIIAVVIDQSANIWVADYERFQVASPTTICHRIIQFYQRMTTQVSSGRIDRDLKPRKSFAQSYK